MGVRLAGFDYARPYYYMVTLKCRKGVAELAQIVAPGRCEMNAVTRAFVNCIRTFHLGCRVLAPIECFTVMPDHVHVILRLLGIDLGQAGEGLAPLRLEAVVEMLMQALEGRYREVTGRREPVFEASWHDWIVAKRGQLAAFTQYVRENPRRRWRRLSHPEYFGRVKRVDFLGRSWYGYGNAALAALPVVEAFKCSRKWVEGSVEWRQAVARAARVGPGCAGVSTFMSPCEKACGHALGEAGGRWIVLSPEGFGPRWHPSRAHEPFCAAGRMLYLSLWPAMARAPTRAELYDRCHEMGDWVAGAVAARGSAVAL